MATSAVCVQGLRGPALQLSWSRGLAGEGVELGNGRVPCNGARRIPGSPIRMKDGTVRAYPPKVAKAPVAPVNPTQTKNPPQSKGGTKIIQKKVRVLREGDKSATIRTKVQGEPATIKLLSRVQQLRLLSKAEKAGLLSAAENAGFSLSSIEKLGLLSKAESFGALSAATDPKTPSLLLTAAAALLVLGPAFVYLVPEDSTPLVVLQVVVALVSVLGGSAAYAASSFVSALQSSD